ncbi:MULTISPECIES: hypothetical protein [Bacillota]|jgi:hypothetical protein|uniref:Phage protein n=1 Tax=[Eubacterium] hominis TaxID=2764325 RepID=A0A7G9GPL9_9FIRM|nr:MULTISPECIES: hypothetical protein [Bacillota]QNM12751.1 hypothetical protein H9Q80_02030 [[Eubacterium] hominis]DAY68680.1 MAG TPA: hypothetical protein [Caudoviricetes sp.]RGB58289.1 hypothetical protein DW271_00925 [Absiella sp. AM22-9]RGB60061.1 hypothetical protein DW120_10545 [Absiella sp. AM10-20]RGB63022.1 hypothetical protein DW113_18740 [Absiella sp. AM09-45]
MDEWIKQLAMLLAGSIVIQITPIKINPWTWLFKWIGEQLNGDLKKEVISIGKTVDQNEIDRIRYEIMDFANSCRNHRQHTKEEYHHIVDINTKYHRLIKKHGIENGVLDTEYAYIERTYQRCLEKGVFDQFENESEEK